MGVIARDGEDDVEGDRNERRIVDTKSSAAGNPTTAMVGGHGQRLIDDCPLMCSPDRGATLDSTECSDSRSSTQHKDYN